MSNVNEAKSDRPPNEADDGKGLLGPGAREPGGDAAPHSDAVPAGHFLLDGVPVPYREGQTLIEAAMAAGHYIPHLCHLPGYKPHGSCKVCTVKVNGRHATSCTLMAGPGMKVESEIEELRSKRESLVQMLFVEGNHFCPSCEKSGDCQLQATGYQLGMTGTHFDHFFPHRAVDASHPDTLLDFNRCILCSLCIRASRDVDGKQVFGLSGRGIDTRVIVNSGSGRLVDTDFSAQDAAASVCPVGAILPKRRGFSVPIGERTFDRATPAELVDSRLPEGTQR